MVKLGITEAYRQVQPRLKKIARRQYDRDEAMGEANLAFMRAWHSYDGRRPFDRWVTHIASRRVRDSARRYAERQQILPRTRLYDLPAPDVFDVTAWLELLSDDARTLAGMALSVADGTPVGWVRERLRYRLRRMGWRQDRIERAWVEVKEAIP